MKKIIALALFLGLVYGGVAFATSTPESAGYIKRSVGGGQDQPTRGYVLVRNPVLNDGTITGIISVGSAVVWDTTSDDGVTVQLTTTSGDNAFAGIAVTSIPTSDNANCAYLSDDIGRRNWGYIQVYGMYERARVTAGGTNGHTAGYGFITSSDKGAITFGVVANSDADNALLMAQGCGGFFYDAASTTATTAEVFIKNE